MTIRSLVVLSALSTCFSSRPSMDHDNFLEEFFQGMNQIRESMFTMQGKMVTSLRESFKSEQMNSPKATISIGEEPSRQSVVISLDGVDISGEHPEASATFDKSLKAASIEIPFEHGSLVIQSKKDYLSVDCTITNKQDSNGKQSTSSRSFRNAQLLSAEIDYEKMPTISYEKDGKILKVELALLTNHSGKKTSLPIEIK